MCEAFGRYMKQAFWLFHTPAITGVWGTLPVYEATGIGNKLLALSNTGQPVYETPLYYINNII